MSESAEKIPIQEVWITKNGLRQRVYRGDNPDHVAWKLKYHEESRPELVSPKK